MCEQCTCATVGWHLFGDWTLVRARFDGMMMKAGDWGLLRMNHPEFAWTNPVVGLTDPWYGIPDTEWDEDDERWCPYEDFMIQAEKLDLPWAAVQCDSGGISLYELIQQGKEAGWNQDEHGYFELWLYHKMGEVVQRYPKGQRLHTTPIKSTAMLRPKGAKPWADR